MTIEKEKLQKIVAICIGGVCVAVVYHQFVIDGIQLKAIGKVQKEISELQARIDKANDNEKKHGSLSVASKRDEPFLAEQESKIIKGDHVAWLWREMGDFADKRKMTRMAVVPEGATSSGLPESESYEASGASLNMFCGYHKLGEFVRDLENSFSTLQVKHLEILGGGEATPETHTVRVQVQLLALREEKLPEGAAAKIAQGANTKE